MAFANPFICLYNRKKNEIGKYMKKRIVIFGDSNTWGYDAKSGGRFNEDWQSCLERVTESMKRGFAAEPPVLKTLSMRGFQGLAIFCHVFRVIHLLICW